MLLLVSEEIASIGIWLVSGIYKVAAFAFKIFTILAQGKLIDTESYQTIIDNFYLILGVVMLFAIAFSLLRGMVNPDDQKQGTSSIKKIIINLITSTIILAFLPSIFSFAFDFQDAILSYNTIGGFFGFGTLGKADTTPEGTTKVEKISYSMVNGVWTAFFNVDVSHDKCISLKSDYPKPREQLEECQKIIETDKEVSLYSSEGGAISNGEVNFLKISDEVDNTGNFNLYDAFSGNIEKGEVDFQWFLSLIGGLALIYIGFSYCFDMALRLIKLVFYQIIAPIPLFLRIVPDNKLSGTFKQWLKVTLTCWAEVFVRIFIFYFCLYLCNEMLDSNFFTDTVYQHGTLVGLFSQAFIIMGIIMFMKRSPKLLSEITGIDSGNMKLGIREKLADGGGLVAGAAIGGLATAGIRNAAESFQNVKSAKGGWSKAKAAFKGIGSIAAGGASGFARAGKAGWTAKTYGDAKKAASAGATRAVEKREKRANYRAAHGGTLFDATIGHVVDFTRSARNYVFDQSVEGLSRESQSMGKIVSNYNAFNDNFEALLEKEQSKGTESVFNGHGFNLQNYAAFDTAAKNVAEARAKFNAGILSKKDLDDAESAYTQARDAARDELMNIALAGTKNNAAYDLLDEKAKAAMQGGMIDAERLQATVLENANTRVVQDIMGTSGSNALSDIANNKPLTTKSFINPNSNTKLKDAAKVEQGRADIKIAEMNKENAAKGDKK